MLTTLEIEATFTRTNIPYNQPKPDGTPRKLMDVSRIHALGWKHKTDLRTGIEKTYRWFLENYELSRKN